MMEENICLNLSFGASYTREDLFPGFSDLFQNSCNYSVLIFIIPQPICYLVAGLTITSVILL